MQQPEKKQSFFVRKNSFLAVVFIFSFFLCFHSDIFAQSLDGKNLSFPFLAETTTDKVNVRSGQSTSFEKVGRLQKGEQVVVVQKEFGWFRIKLPKSAVSYVSADYIQIIRGDVAEVTGSRVNIRAGNGINFSVVGQMKKGDKVRVLSTAEGWSKIEPVDQSYGWVAEKFLTFKSKEIPTPRIVKAPPPPPPKPAPIRNIYVLKRMAEQKAMEEAQRKAVEEAKKEAERRKNLVFAKGVVKSLGDRSISQNIRHKIVVDEKTSYFLKGYRQMIDGFLQSTVKIEGKVQKDITAQHPVLLVTKIHLVL